MAKPTYDLTVIEEIAAIKEFYELSYEQLSRDMVEIVGVSAATLFRMLLDDHATQPILTAVEVWLREKGRKKYPL